VPHIVVTNSANVSLPWQPSLVSGLNSRTIVASGTSVVLSDVEFAALSPTAISSGTLLDGGDTSLSLVGIKVSRTTANLPQTATGDIFQVSTGRVWIVNLIATVTTAIQAQDTLVKVVWTPTGGSVGDVTANTTDWTGAVVGSQFSAKFRATTDVQTKTAIGTIFPVANAQQPQLMLNTGKLSVTTAASSTGQARWDIWYLPIDAGATVTPL